MREEEELPEGWTQRRLGQGLLVDIQPGFACGAHNRGGDGVPHLRPMNVAADGHISLDDVKFVPKTEMNREERWLRSGDVLFNNTNSPALVGKTAHYGEPEPRAFSNHMTRLRTDQSLLDPRFLALVLHQLWRQGLFEERCNNHVSQASIGREVLLETPIPLPSLLEQERIVEVLQVSTRRVDAVRRRLSGAMATCHRYRRAVLASACEGRLTSGWRASQGEPLSNADGGAPWPVVAAGSLFEVADYGTSVRCERDVPGGIPVLRIPNIASGRLEISDLKFAPRKSLKAGEADVREGDVLVCRTNGSLDLIGKAAVVRGLSRPHSFASYLIRLRVRANAVLPDFFHLFLSSPAGRDQIERESRTTAGQYNLNLRILNELELPLPPLPEQREIVRLVEALFALADAIEKRVAAASARADKLTQAILAKAFRGELVPTEAELSRRREAAAATPPPAARPTAARPATRRSR